MNQNKLFKYIDYPLPEDIKTLYNQGLFDECNKLIDEYLKSADTELEAALLLRKEIIKLLPDEYPYTKGEALSLIREYIPDFKDEELDECHIDYILINNERHYFGRFIEVLVNSFPELHSRMVKEHTLVIHNNHEDELLKEAMSIMKTNGKMSVRIRVSNTIKVNDDIFTPDNYLVHMPIPKPSDYISDISIDSIYPNSGIIDSPEAHQRTVTFNEYMDDNHEFNVEYSFTNTVRYIDPDKLINDKTHLEYKDPSFSLEEEFPHIIFTDKVKELSRRICEGINDPVLKVKAIYDYITLNFQYSFMPSYIVMDHILDNAIDKQKGDCGVVSLLFITLCRLNGIPAIWQSGYTSEDDFLGGHDWAAYYIEPFGYIRTDVSYGLDAHRFKDEERRRFYMCNIDPYRMLANDRFYTDFATPKKYFRADPYDNQLGEIENSSHGLNFNEFTRNKKTISVTKL